MTRSPIEIEVVAGKLIGNNEYGTFVYEQSERVSLMDAIEEAIAHLLIIEDVMRTREKT